MNYEEMTYEYILDRMITRVTEKYPNLDNREGSIVFNALSPAAIELAIMYSQLDNVLAQSFVETASREYKLLGCEQMGMDITVFDARQGIFKGVFNVEVEIGSRWNCDLYNYEVVEFLGMDANDFYTYSLRCETEGSEPNNTTGDLTAITDSPEGLLSARLTECLIEGEAETSDEGINEAYKVYVNNTNNDGNVDQYKQWCNEYEGIGNSKIFPLWNGANTVKVSILSVSNNVASQTLIDEFQQYIDPGVKGMGDGVAPIGAFVTVTTATEVPVSVSADVTMASGYTDTSPISTALEQYFRELSYTKNVVAYMNVGAKILAVEGVETINNLLLNGGTSDILLGDEEIPSLGTVEWVVG